MFSGRTWAVNIEISGELYKANKSLFKIQYNKYVTGIQGFLIAEAVKSFLCYCVRMVICNFFPLFVT